MNNIILEYQELDKKIKNIKNEVSGGSAQKNLDSISNSIKVWQTKILELEETSKELLSSLNKLMEVEKKGIAYVEKCKKMNLDKMSKEELEDFDTKASQTAKQLAELEARITAHNAEVKKVVLDYKMYRKKILDAKEKRDSLKTETAQKLEDRQPDIEDLKKEQQKLEKGIEPALLAKYKQLKQEGIFPVFVPLVDKRCGGCRVELSSSAIEKLKNGDSYECERCRSIIYIEK